MHGKCKHTARLFFGAVCAIGLLMGLAPARASDGKLDVGLDVTIRSQDGRDVPEFRVSVKNVSGETVSLVDVRRDTDVERNYAPVQIVSVDPTAGIRPGHYNPDREPDLQYMSLAPGGEFEYVASPGVYLPELVQGRYRARILYYPAPEDSRIAYASRPVEFEILRGPPASAASKREVPVAENWAMRCVSPEIRTHCIMHYKPAGSDPHLWESWYLTIDWLTELQLHMHQSRTCNLMPVVMQVDDNRPVELKWSGVYGLEGDEALDAVDQMISGNELVMKVHLSRDCAEHEVRIPLDDFRHIWRKFMALPSHAE